MKRIRAVILDFDGVLAESNGEKDSAFEEFFALYPKYAEAMRQYHKEHYTSSRVVKIAYYVEHLMERPGAQDLQDRMAGEFSHRVVDRVINCPEVPGAKSFLEEFSGVVPLYISSVTPQDELNRIVRARRIDMHIKEAFGNPPHTKVDAAEMILKREGLDAEEVAFVGDSASDYEVALQVGLRFLARDSGQSFPSADLELFADLHGVASRLRTLL
mgnify:FL=1